MKNLFLTLVLLLSTISFLFATNDGIGNVIVIDSHKNSKCLNFNSENNFKIVDLVTDRVSTAECRTFTFTFNLLFGIETTMTICCTAYGLLPNVSISCFELKSLRGNQNIIEYDINDLLIKNNLENIKEIELVKSSIETFGDLKIQIKKGKYQVYNNNVIYLEFEAIK